MSIIALGVSIWRNLTSSNVNIKHIEKRLIEVQGTQCMDSGLLSIMDSVLTRVASRLTSRAGYYP